MMGMLDGQISLLDYEVFNKLIPTDHLLVKIDKEINFSFIYDLAKPYYSDIGRDSHDPVMVFKMSLLEYLYDISDKGVASRTQTDVCFRWFLGLSLDDKVLHKSALSDLRCKRFDEKMYNAIFDNVIIQCINKKLIQPNRFIIDTTNVDANVNFPSRKKLIEKAFMNVIKEIEKFNQTLAHVCTQKFNKSINALYTDEKSRVRSKKHAQVGLEIINYIYLKTYDHLQTNDKFLKAYELCFQLVRDLAIKGKSSIISIVDPEARVAHKTRGVMKRGYKNHIIIDEDSEIILASKTTPFNVGDQKELKSLIEKVQSTFNVSPKEVSADTVYGSSENRAFLLDRNIVSSIRFPAENVRENKSYGVDSFVFSSNLESVTCRNNIISETYNDSTDKSENEYRIFKFNRSDCDVCIYRNECLPKNKKGKIHTRFKKVQVARRYDAVLNDRKRNLQESFVDAQNKRYKVERRFATMVRNHSLRRSRYIGTKQTTKHVIMSNLACNVVRIINLMAN